MLELLQKSLSLHIQILFGIRIATSLTKRIPKLFKYLFQLYFLVTLSSLICLHTERKEVLAIPYQPIVIPIKTLTFHTSTADAAAATIVKTTTGTDIHNTH